MEIRKYEKCIAVAEVAGNHGGSLSKAKEYVEAAARAGADYVKFQKRAVDLLPESVAKRPRTDDHAFGPTEGDHRRALEFDIAQHAELKEFCEALGVGYACSAWDEKSYNQLVDLGVDYIKIPSAKNQDFERWNRDGQYGQRRELHVSLGLLTGEQRDLLLSRNQLHRIVYYGCTSKYPCGSDETYLMEIPYLVERSGVAGFSGHHNGIALDIAAYALGATWIERHFTLDRTSKGTDHAASLEPQGFAKLVRDLEAVRQALRGKPFGLPSCEIEMHRKFKGG